MALSTTRTLLTQTGINTHQVLDVGGLSSSGIATFSNFKTGTSDVHSSGYNVGTGLTVRANYIGLTGDVSATGVITATSFVGSGANLTGVASTDNIKTSTTANFSDGIQVGGSTTLTGALSATTATANLIVVGSAVTSNSQGIDVTGVITATTFKGSGANLTSLPAANLTGTLPAIDGSNLTGIDASSIKNGNDVKIQATASGATVTGVITAVGGNPNEGAFLKGTAVGVGTTTLAGRNAGVGTAPGTIIFNATSGILQVYVNDLDTWQNVSSAEGYSFQATGGTKSTTSRSGYAVHTFTAPGTFTVLSNTVTGGEYLIVAGGGGGGKGSLPGVGNEVGAGGAGGHRSFSGQTFTPGSYTVVVGSGGPGSGTGGDGGTSSVFGNSSTGAGRGAGANYRSRHSRSGGSGGGGDGGSTAMTPNAGGTTGYGDPGTANTGGGGGGNGVYQGLGGNGGSGVVIIAYPTS